MMLPHMLQDFAARDKVPAAGGKVPEERTPSTLRELSQRHASHVVGVDPVPKTVSVARWRKNHRGSWIDLQYVNT